MARCLGLLIFAASGGATTLYFDFTVQEILAQYDTVALPTFSSSEVGLLDMYVRPDDPDVLAGFNFVDIGAPTFAGAPTNPPWSSTSVYSAPGPSTHLPASALFRNFADLVDGPSNVFVYMTSYGGTIYEFDLSEAKRYPLAKKFTVGISTNEPGASALAGTEVNWEFRVRGDTLQVDSLGDPSGLTAYASGTKQQFLGTFAVTSVAYTPEPATFLLGLASLLGMAFAVKFARRRPGERSNPGQSVWK